MPKPTFIELTDGTVIPILYEDRSVLAIDKPAGWLLAPDSWDRTGRNLQLALRSSIQTGDFWARSRNLDYLRFAHRLDADTSGVLILIRNPSAMRAYTGLFEARRVEKSYLAVVRGVPDRERWICRLKLARHPTLRGRMKVDQRHGQEATSRFRVLRTSGRTALVAAQPLTGRTHQIRVHLAESGHPVIGDALYGPATERRRNTPDASGFILALRAVSLGYVDPFQRRDIRIEAPAGPFLKAFGFGGTLPGFRARSAIHESEPDCD